MSNSINQSTMTHEQFFNALAEYEKSPANSLTIEEMEQLIQKADEVIGTLKQALNASKED